MILRIITLLSTLGITSFVWATSFDINLHDNVLRATYASYIDKKTIVDFGVLLLNKNNKNEDTTLLHTGLNIVFKNSRLGIRAIYATPGNSDILSLGFGGQGQVYLAHRVSLGGHFYYAPSITSFLDSTGYREFGTRFNFMLTQKAYLYVGYRNVKVNNNVELDDGFNIGAKLFF